MRQCHLNQMVLASALHFSESPAFFRIFAKKAAYAGSAVLHFLLLYDSLVGSRPDVERNRYPFRK